MGLEAKPGVPSQSGFAQGWAPVKVAWGLSAIPGTAAVVIKEMVLPGAGLGM